MTEIIVNKASQSNLERATLPPLMGHPNVVPLFAFFWIFWCKMKITQADAPTVRMVCHPCRLIGAPTSAIPTIFCQMPFLSQPSLFILAWDRHKICWLAYLVAWWVVLINTQKLERGFS